jgi:ABC-type Fe3+/spermidine/putrescine transport system ATPase subunit
MPANTPILAVSQLGNRYQGQPLLQGVSFTLAAGEILCLLGPSGSGKTTLLRLIAGLEEADCGTILFAGQDIRAIPPHRRNFGMMFQEYALFPHLNVLENIAFGLEMQHCPTTERQQRAEAMLAMVGLSGFARRRIDELSGGERQRVALARSLAPEPRLLLLDEPLGSLDRTLRDRLTGEIRAILKALGVTAIFVTHDQAEAFSVADQVAILHSGTLQQFARPEEVYRQPRNVTVASFLGFQNLLPGHLDEAGFFTSGEGGLRFRPAGGSSRRRQPGGEAAVTLLLRPEGALLAGSEPHPGWAEVSGTVTERRFHGHSYRLTVACAAGTMRFDLPIDPPPPDNGKGVRLQLNPGAIVLLDPDQPDNALPPAAGPEEPQCAS